MVKTRITEVKSIENEEINGNDNEKTLVTTVNNNNNNNNNNNENENQIGYKQIKRLKQTKSSQVKAIHICFIETQKSQNSNIKNKIKNNK